MEIKRFSKDTDRGSAKMNDLKKLTTLLTKQLTKQENNLKKLATLLIKQENKILNAWTNKYKELYKMQDRMDKQIATLSEDLNNANQKVTKLSEENDNLRKRIIDLELEITSRDIK